jgi:hypothetical protein
VFFGSPFALTEMMTAMDAFQLFVKGEYMIIYVDMLTYSPKEALKYLWSKCIVLLWKVLQLGNANIVLILQLDD